MTKEPRVHELVTLKTIAETLNQPGDLTPMLTLVLEKLLELTGLTTGWIFLSDGRPEYVFAADYGLPPALLSEEKQPMQAGRCWCMDRYKDGRLNNAVNIMGCKRLEDAEACRRGDTLGITHHATVPLRSGSRRVGVLNVAAPGKEHFSDEELALLQAVAFQIGGAVERMRLYAAEQRRADLYERLGTFSRLLRIASMTHTDSVQLAEQAVALIAGHFEWTFAAVLERIGDDFIVRASHAHGRLNHELTHLPPEGAAWLRCIGEKQRFANAAGTVASDLAHLANQANPSGLPPLKLADAMAVHVPNAGLSLPWIIVVGSDSERGHFDIESEVLEALGEHFAVALDSASLETNRRELARLDERNRLARDLHDSVCQLLFSLSMTAKGTDSLLAAAGQEMDAARMAVKDMQSLSRQALKEMRELIMQLRPAGLETGLLTALHTYGEKLGLRVSTQLSGVRELPRSIEETLWRIGQEALNNVCKHAGVSAADAYLALDADQAVLRISDSGRGIARLSKRPRHESIGLSIMRERTEALGGRLTVTSSPSKGTVVEAAIPMQTIH
ncbi:GAF domain-containing sensor histidine kinase [Paenibacillus rhizovicinus]|uniref:GAF domain-containing sensor histidine kinase n=1 Tax=Paenibacillus rhizovicinus TaxID=2704463 RepID=UPI001CDB768D|nr:GAF domain-containing sensor histidine kinase [Paenibacillus rhizovicinus]